MLKRASFMTFLVAIGVSLTTGGMPASMVLQTKAADPKPQDKLALGEDDVKQLLLLMDIDKNGKISRQEWLAFMKAEFDRLDTDKSGELDVPELTQSKLQVSPFLSVGK